MLKESAGVAIKSHVPVEAESGLRSSLIGQRTTAEIKGPARPVEDSFDNVRILLMGRIRQRVDSGDHADGRVCGQAGGELADESR